MSPLEQAEREYTAASETKRLADGDLRLAEARCERLRREAQDAWNGEQRAAATLLALLRGER